ncbi:hypothetical protein GOV12_05955 [Candidatus Pacearchaeota archaeon]|nr:hypothetical protein [Candidatus Pacearchaeota archaeon]
MSRQDKIMDGGRLSQLNDLASYPCVDVYLESQREMKDEYGIDTREDTVFRELVDLEDDRAGADDAYFELRSEGCEPGSIVVPRNWGIQRKFLERLDCVTLDDIHYGKENLRVPTQMLDLENPFEILANYLATGFLKPCNRHQKDDVPRKHFSDVVKFMNRYSYGNGVFTKSYQTFKDSNRFPVESGYQEKRLSSLSGEDKRRFCASFFKNTIPSIREEPDNPRAFFVPRTRNQKIDNIMGYFSGRFQRERA